jgi:hypothetical protein
MMDKGKSNTTTELTRTEATVSPKHIQHIERPNNNKNQIHATKKMCKMSVFGLNQNKSNSWIFEQ